MNTKKKIFIIIGLVITIAIVLTFALKKDSAENHTESKITKAADQYFKDTLNTEVYIQALIENGYLESSSEPDALLKKEGDKIVKEKGDMQKAKEESKTPAVIIEADGFKNGEWTKESSDIKVSLRNNGNSFYTKEDITDIKWISKKENGAILGEKLELLEDEIDEKYILHIEFKSGELIYEKEIDVKVDKKAPTLVKKSFDAFGPYAIYTDICDNITVYYAITEENKIPKKDVMAKKPEVVYESTKTYYAWSYAVDEMGNESEIHFLGEYKPKIGTVIGPTTSVSENDSSE